MAVAVQEFISSDNAGDTSRTATGFANLAVGDLMISHFVFGDEGVTITIPSGWTQINKTENVPGNFTSQIAYKIADAGDVSGNSFQFSHNGASSTIRLRILRITGHRASATTVITASSGQANTASTTVTAPTVTPVEPESLIMLFASMQRSTAQTASGYALATSSPSFSEHYDPNLATITVACASGARTAITATGNGTATLTESERSIGQLVVISPPISQTFTETITMSESLNYDMTTIVSDTVTMTEDVDSDEGRIRNTDKNLEDWTNLDKS